MVRLSTNALKGPQKPQEGCYNTEDHLGHPMAAIIPDPFRRWVQGTAYEATTDEYTQDGTCIGIGTIDITRHARACGVTYASPVSYTKPEKDLGDLFLELFG